MIANLSCASNNSKADDLKWKVTQLENRIHSLIMALRNPNQKNNNLYNTPYTAPTVKSKNKLDIQLNASQSQKKDIAVLGKQSQVVIAGNMTGNLSEKCIY